ncbi:MAG TPA: glutamate--tRNA ligase [Puia sp.]|nr:glutamate--tRNA ligase [Puia sp.]
MARKVRVRFAPSPTGGLHLGGVRTVLYNFLYARRHDGDFVLRIEDTDQSRYVPGAEQYIFDSLAWCGLEPDEGPHKGGSYGPYRQSERKALGIYEKYAKQLVDQGHAYYAFDSTEELDAMREQYKTPENPTPQYNYAMRHKMRNSLHLPPDETQRLLAAGAPFTIRAKIDPNQTVRFHDMIRGEVVFSTNGVDDKVLLKADGMPTYHLAVVVDDYLMDISHAFRGEEWLPSAPVHILLWTWLFGIGKMPQWAHLPLILKPDGRGKLSKRDGDRLGFPVFAMNWKDPNTGEVAMGFRETGFLPQAFVNLLALLGWNDGTEHELYTLEELVEVFSMDRVHKGGAKFDYEKAKWFNHEWIKWLPASAYSQLVRTYFHEVPETETESDRQLAEPDDGKFEMILDLVKERCHLLPDFVQQAGFFFHTPRSYDLDSIRPKWNDAKKMFFVELILQLELEQPWEAAALEVAFKEMAAARQMKPGDLLAPFRIMLVGGKFGPPVFVIAGLLGREETIRRIRHVLGML